MASAIAATSRRPGCGGSHGILTSLRRGSGIVQSPRLTCPPVISQTLCGGGGPTSIGRGKPILSRECWVCCAPIP